jgi:hypothetical protein
MAATELMVAMVNAVLQDAKDPLALGDTRDTREKWGHKETLVLRVSRDFKDSTAQQDLKAHKDIKAIWGLKDSRAILVLREIPVKEVLKGSKVIPEIEGSKDSKAIPDLKVLKGFRATKV